MAGAPAAQETAVKIKELREKRAKLATTIREMADRQKDWAEEDRSNWDKLNADYDALTAEIETAEQSDQVAARAAAVAEEQERRAGEPATGTESRAGTGAPGREDRNGRRTDDENRDQSPAGIEYRGQNLLEAEGRVGEQLRARADGEYRSAFRGFLRGAPFEARALQADLDVQGGYLVPTQFMATLLQAVDNVCFFREMATVIPVIGADSLGVPSLDTDISDADWTAEIKTGNEDTAMAFGKRELRPHPLAKRIKLSKTLVRKSAIGAEALVRDRLAYKFGVAQENHFLNGHGAEQPLGVFAASAQGISTGRDVSTDMAATAITADGLIEVKYTLKSQYWGAARWLFHRDAVKQIRKLKDGEGQYLWVAGLQAGQADRILDVPIRVSEYVPNTFVTGQYVGILGDFSNYWIADALSMTIQVLLELYAETNQNGYLARAEVDGMPVLEEAFVRVKLA